MTNLEKERLAALSFNSFFKIGPRNISKLLLYFGSLDRAYRANFQDLRQAGIKESLIYDFLNFRRNFSPAIVLNKLKQEDIKYLYFKEPSYPILLKEIFDPPTVIYFKGSMDFNFEKCLAIIGSRKHGYYGEKVIESLITPLIEQGIIIVSGLASGIDSLAHQKTLDNKGKTIAVLGSSLEKKFIYPAQNRFLADNIIKSGGALISEFPLGTAPLKQNFPQRNRIISGLSQAVLIVEAQERSGSLITANQALEQGRELMVVPGSIFSEFSAGANTLISKGAKLIRNSDDILECFSEKNLIETSETKVKDKIPLLLDNDEEKIIFSLIKRSFDRSEIINSEKIENLTKLDTATINSTLSILEVKNLIKKDYNNYNLVNL